MTATNKKWREGERASRKKNRNTKPLTIYTSGAICEIHPPKALVFGGWMPVATNIGTLLT